MGNNFCSVKRVDTAFKIPFVGLKLGVHTFDFELNKPFFDEIEEALIEEATVLATIVLEKKETMMIAEFFIDGTVQALCDRCNDPLELTIQGEYRMIYKFGTELSDDENLVVLHPDAFEIDVKPQLYEFVCVSLPSRVLHPIDVCNPEVIAVYDSLIVNANEPDELDEDDEDWDDFDDDNDDEDWDDEDEPILPLNPPPNGEAEPEIDYSKPIDPRWSVLKNLN